MMDKHFVLDTGSAPVRDDRFEKLYEALGFSLQYSSSVLNPITSGSRVCGVVLGNCLPLHHDSDDANGTSRGLGAGIDVSNGIEKCMASFHRNFCGRYVAVVEDGQDLWLFGDPVCAYPIVVDVETGRAASSAFALFPSAAEYERRLNSRLTSVTDLSQDDWYPSGLTAHHGVERLLPNHAISLSSGTIRRIWRPPAVESKTIEFDAVARHMTRVAVAARQKAAQGGTLYVTATAGYDSRVALAASRDVKDDLTAFTLVTGGVDVDIAARLCNIAAIRHITLMLKEASPGEHDEWAKRNGHCVGGANMRLFPTMTANFSSADVFVSGTGGEIGRAFYWNQRDLERNDIDAQTLLLRMKLSPNPEFLKKTQAWIDGLDGLAVPQVLDLAYVEQRMGAWGSPQFYGAVGHPEVVSPFCARPFIEYNVTCPPEERLGNAVPRNLIANLWPELLQVPFNRHGDLRDWYAKIQRFRPSKIRRKVRQLAGYVR